MKKIIVLTLLGFSPIIGADEAIQMSNGMTCWRNNTGFTYGCSGGSPTGDSGFNDAQTGDRYESIGGNQAVNTRTGQVISAPQINNNGYFGGYEYE